MIKFGIKTFVLPDEDSIVTKFMNKPNIRIMVNERFPCAKTETVLLHLQYEEDDYGEETEEEFL